MEFKAAIIAVIVAVANGWKMVLLSGPAPTQAKRGTRVVAVADVDKVKVSPDPNFTAPPGVYDGCDVYRFIPSTGMLDVRIKQQWDVQSTGGGALNGDASAGVLEAGDSGTFDYRQDKGNGAENIAPAQTVGIKAVDDAGEDAPVNKGDSDSDGFVALDTDDPKVASFDPQIGGGGYYTQVLADGSTVQERPNGAFWFKAAA